MCSSPATNPPSPRASSRVCLPAAGLRANTLHAFRHALQYIAMPAQVPACRTVGGVVRSSILLLAGRQGQRVRLICVPKFSSTGTLLLVNLSTLQVQPITFDARMDL